MPNPHFSCAKFFPITSHPSPLPTTTKCRSECGVSPFPSLPLVKLYARSYASFPNSFSNSLSLVSGLPLNKLNAYVPSVRVVGAVRKETTKGPPKSFPSFFSDGATSIFKALMSRIAAAVVVVVVVVFVLGPSGVRSFFFFFFFLFFFGGAATSLVPASVRARALESVRTCEKKKSRHKKKSEKKRVQKNQKNCRESSPPRGRVPPFVCPHARVREWVRGRKKERFQSKKLEKIRPICHIYPHYTTAPSARFLRLSFLAAPRGKKKRARQEIEQSGAPSRFLSLSLCLSATSHRVRSNRTIGIPKR